MSLALLENMVSDVFKTLLIVLKKLFAAFKGTLSRPLALFNIVKMLAICDWVNVELSLMVKW
jgi:hypothetical protein